MNEGFILPANHLLFTAAQSVQELAMPLFNHFNLQDFSFCRFYYSPQGNKVTLPLTTNPELGVATLNNITNSNSLVVLGQEKERFIFQHAVKEIIHPASKQLYEQQIKLMQAFNGGIEFTIRRHHAHYTDNFDFLAKRGDAQALYRFINHIDLLEHFIDYFYEKAAHWLKIGARHHRLHFPKPSQIDDLKCQEEEAALARLALLKAMPLNR